MSLACKLFGHDWTRERWDPEWVTTGEVDGAATSALVRRTRTEHFHACVRCGALNPNRPLDAPSAQESPR